MIVKIVEKLPMILLGSRSGRDAFAKLQFVGLAKFALLELYGVQY
jgi:hypothetical protein